MTTDTSTQAPGPDQTIPPAEQHQRNGWNRLAEKDLAGAEAEFNQALKLDIQAVDAFYGLALALKGQGNKEAALQAFHNAENELKLHPNTDQPQRGTILKNLIRLQIEILEKG